MVVTDEVWLEPALDYRGSSTEMPYSTYYHGMKFCSGPEFEHQKTTLNLSR